MTLDINLSPTPAWTHMCMYTLIHTCVPTCVNIHKPPKKKKKNSLGNKLWVGSQDENKKLLGKPWAMASYISVIPENIIWEGRSGRVLGEFSDFLLQTWKLRLREVRTHLSQITQLVRKRSRANTLNSFFTYLSATYSTERTTFYTGELFLLLLQVFISEEVARAEEIRDLGN